MSIKIDSKRGRKNTRAKYVENVAAKSGGYSRTMKYYMQKHPKGK